MNNLYFYPRLQVLVVLLVFAMLAPVHCPWIAHSVLDIGLGEASDASASQSAASVTLSLTVSLAPTVFQGGALQ